jgi:hypothetical protein
VTLNQRFGSTLNLNVHFHMLFLDCLYVIEVGRLRFRRVTLRFLHAPDIDDIADQMKLIATHRAQEVEEELRLGAREAEWTSEI